MELLSTVAQWRQFAVDVRHGGAVVGLVPTMGALHAGHAALIAAARAECGAVIVTSFVNPLQFNDPEDLARYPRTPAADRTLSAAAGADALVELTEDAMWPDRPVRTTVTVRELTDRFEGADRPGHFDGVATVVARLFAVTGPCRAFFGEKDFQQLAVVRQLAADLAFPAAVCGVPTVREPDGLALSSRNVRLSAGGRSAALGLSAALGAVAAPAPVPALRSALRSTLARYPLAVHYAEVVDPATLAPLGDDATGPGRALVAASVDGVRLIDNGPVTARAGGR